MISICCMLHSCNTDYGSLHPRDLSWWRAPLCQLCYPPGPPADILPIRQGPQPEHQYDSVSFVYWRAIRQILYPGNICLILLSTDYHRYSDVIKRQIVMGDRVRLMLNSIWKHFQNQHQARQSLLKPIWCKLWERFSLTQLWSLVHREYMSRQEESLIRLSDVSGYHWPHWALSSLCRKYCVM